jgi:hypothetical protein
MPTVLTLLGMRFFYWDNRDYMIEHWKLFFKTAKA